MALIIGKCHGARNDLKWIMLNLPWHHCFMLFVPFYMLEMRGQMSGFIVMSLPRLLQMSLLFLFSIYLAKTFNQTCFGLYVFSLSPRTYTLSCVYSVKDAHPIFVTALTFLPICESHSAASKLTVAGKPGSTERDRSPIFRSEQSYELVSVSVDRKLCWHCGPRSSQINRLAHGLSPDPVGVWARGQSFLQQLMIYYGLIFLLPVLLSLFDRIFYGLFWISVISVYR